LKSTQLMSKRKYVILIIFIVAAFITPPDVISQVLLAVPLLALYEVSIIIARRREKQQKKILAKKIASGDQVLIDTQGMEISEWIAKNQKEALANMGMTQKELEEQIKLFSGE